MKKILFDKAYKTSGGYVNKKVLSATEKELLFNYRKVLDKTKKQLEILAEKIGKDGVLELAEMNKYNRLNTLMYNINTEISGLVKSARKLTNGIVKDTARESYKKLSYEINQGVNKGAGVHINYQFGMIDPVVIKASITNPLYLTAIEDLKASTMIGVKREITQGLIGGESYFTIAKRVKERLNISASKARTIVRTEAGKAWSMGHEEAHEKAEELGIVVKKQWVATLDSRTRESHQDMDGEYADKDGYFKLNSGDMVLGPRLGGPPEEVINCVISGTEVSVDNKIKAITKRFYSGEVIKISLASGANITVTPNHPILTGRGWITANLVNYSDCIGYTRIGNIRKFFNPYKYNIPIIIDKIFDFFSVIFTPQRIAGTDKQFHGDGIIDSDINIIFIDSLLKYCIKSHLIKNIGKFLFPIANFCKKFLISNCFIAKFKFSNGCFSSCVISFFTKFLSILKRCLFHSFIHRLALISGLISNGFKSFVDCISTDIKHSGNLFDGFPRFVKFDKIIDIKILNFSGHVFNLETKNGYYFASNISNDNDNVNKIICHNCRCRMIDVIEGFEPTQRMSRDIDKSYREKSGPIVETQTYKEWEKTQN